MNRRQNNDGRSKPRFVLFTPAIEDADGFVPKLAAACGAADVASVILRLSPEDPDLVAPAREWDLSARIRTLAPTAQAAGAIVLLDGLLHLVVPTAVDGVHLTEAASIRSVRSILEENRIIGAGNLATRHDAMVAAENGADYVMFGEPDNNGKRPSTSALIERVTWWAELFEVPSVAYAAHLDEVAELARAGADFIALGEEAIWNVPEGPATALVAAADRLNAAELVE